MSERSLNIETLIFEFMDQCKFIFFPEQWHQAFMDYSKNEIFVLLMLYRKSQVNMTEIADYMNIPLNTVTGVVNRLEKKNMILRQRSKEDKRVVTVILEESGKLFLKNEINVISGYFSKIVAMLSEEEKSVLASIPEKIFKVLQEGKPKEEKRVKRIIIE